MFSIDQRIQSTSFELGDWPLSRVFLKNEREYPWLILVPRKANVQEIHQLTQDDRCLLTDEMNQLSLVVSHYFKPQKLNVAALGNVVPQLHIHVVGRNEHDKLWPQSIWQASFTATPYNEDELKELLPVLKGLINDAGLSIK